MQHTDDLGYFLPQIWESWRHPLQAAEFTGWYVPVFVLPYQGSLRAVMLDREAGAASFPVDTLIQVCSYCLMTKHVFNIDVLVDPDVQDCVLLALPHVVREIWKNRLVRSGVWIDFSSRPPSKCNFWTCCSYLFGG